MRRLTAPLFVISLVAAALVVGACGGDDDNSNNQPGLTIEAGPPPAPDGPTDSAQDPGATGDGGQNSGSGKSKKSKQGSSGASGAEGIIDDTAPPATAKKPSKKELREQEIASALSKKEQNKVSHDAARRVCREERLVDIRKTYKVKGKSDADVAKAVSKAYKPKSRREAAYSGCLKGLSDR